MGVREVEEASRLLDVVWRLFASRAENGEIRELSGVTASFSNAPLSFLNLAYLSEPVRDEDDWRQRVETAVAYGNSQGLPWMLVTCDEWLPESVRKSQSALLEQKGLHPVMPWTGMVTDELAPPTRPMPPELTLRRVESGQAQRDVSDLNCLAYGLPVELGRESLEGDGLWRDDTFGVVGYRDGQPVATATTIVVDGCRYVAMVATQSEARGRGYAEAVMRRSLEHAHAATGVKRTLLHATEMGRPVYERMGYRRTSGFWLHGAGD